MRITTLNLSLRTHDNASPTSFVGIFHSLYTIYISTCREIRSLDITHQSVNIDFWIIDICATSVNDFTEIMGRNICRHTYSNTVSAIYEQVWNLCWHDCRLNERIIEVVRHVNRILVKVIHDVLSHL